MRGAARVPPPERGRRSSCPVLASGLPVGAAVVVGGGGGGAGVVGAIVDGAAGGSGAAPHPATRTSSRTSPAITTRAYRSAARAVSGCATVRAGVREGGGAVTRITVEP